MLLVALAMVACTALNIPVAAAATAIVSAAPTAVAGEEERDGRPLDVTDVADDDDARFPSPPPPPPPSTLAPPPGTVEATVRTLLASAFLPDDMRFGSPSGACC